MPNFQDLRMADLISKFRAIIAETYETKKLSLLLGASPKLQDIYNFHITAENSFSAQEENLKSLYTTFNYAAVICNNAVKTKKLSQEDSVLLNECLELLLKCCDLLTKSLKGE
ncbi:MAG: hypothetical protein LUD27_01285 [Clostridia bacterium]|nr:hypothetical protein [Clostridia bacterium]